MPTRQERNEQFLDDSVLPHNHLLDFLQNGLSLLRHFRNGSDMFGIVYTVS
jgi:hypothetical protein